MRPEQQFSPPQQVSVAELNAALAKAQGEFPKIARSAKVDTGSYSYSYAPLEGILKAVRPVLSKNGLSLIQLLEPGPALTTELRHSSGGVISASFPFTAPESIQKLGSAISYLRRYAIQAMLGIATETDDDGAAAVQADKEKPKDGIEPWQHKVIGQRIGELKKKWPTTEGQKSYEQQLREAVGVKSRKDMTYEQADTAIQVLNGWLEAAEAPF